MNKDPLLITATYNGYLTIWNTKKQKWTEDVLYKPDNDFSINKLSISSDSYFLGAACSEGLRIFDISKNKENFSLKRLQNNKSNVVSLGFDIKSQYIYYATEGGTLNLLDLRDGKQKTLHSQEKDINTCLLNPNQGELIFGDSNGNVKVFDLVQNKIKANLCLSNGIALRAIDFSLDASLFAVADQEGTVRTVSMAEDQILRVINKTKIHDDYILNIKFSNDKKYLASCSADQTVKIFEIQNNGKIQEKHILYGHTKWVWDISILSSNKHLLSVSTDGSLKLWDIENGNIVKEFYNDSALKKDNEKNFRKGYVAIAFKDFQLIFKFNKIFRTQKKRIKNFKFLNKIIFNELQNLFYYSLLLLNNNQNFMGNCYEKENTRDKQTINFSGYQLQMVKNLQDQFPDVQVDNSNQTEYKVLDELPANFKQPIKPCQFIPEFKYKKIDDSQKLFYGPILIKTKNNETIYFGEMQNGKRQGVGLQFWNNGGNYQGNWYQDKPNGYGRYIHENGETYEGEWKNQYAEGQGKFYQKDGGILEGQWKNDFQHGEGEEIWPDGTNYKGQYKNGMKHGRGIFQWNDKEYYDGEFYENKIEGYGVHYWEDGSHYKGNWLNFEMHGQGEFYWPNKRRYSGYYKNGKKHGKGIFYWADGNTCEGTWDNGVLKQNNLKGNFENSNIPNENKEGQSFTNTRKGSIQLNNSIDNN